MLSLLFSGITQAIFTCIVLLRSCLRKKFYSQFLVGVCLSSIGFLLTVLMNWMFVQGIPVFTAPGLCQMYVFCSHFFPFLAFLLSVSSALLILYDLTRLKSVKWMNSPGAAKMWVIGLSILAFTIYSYKTWTHGAFRRKSRTECSVIPESEKAMEVLNAIDLLLLLYLPTFCFLTFDIGLLSWTCSRAVKVSLSSIVVTVLKSSDDVYRRRHAEVLKIVLCYSVCFHLLVTPRAVSTSVVTFNRYVALYLCRHLQQVCSTVNQCLQILFYFFFAINPIFPFCVSSKFRRNVSVLFSQGCAKNIVQPQVRSPLVTL
ncbi:unnamed protein product [Candidula unifasciata]|uniref:G-protein coupled receptors family 1 profile domain-containing protein n=1 Tax=Candidula unifasciata TaxID=100452 RepID=A0A8S3ZDC4_9EUPU|nr:unnamed protein product [Candidula unifasciata]